MEPPSSSYKFPRFTPLRYIIGAGKFQVSSFKLSKQISIGVLSIFLTSVIQAFQVVASVDANAITVNDVFTYKIEVIDVETNPQVDISPLLKNFTLISGPGQQTNISWVNGKMTSSRSLTWTLVPNRAGTLTIPALMVKVGQISARTKPIRINVSQSKQTKSTENLILIAEVDKEEAFVGEQITVTYKLYTRVDMSIEDLELPDFVGFWAEELFAPKHVNFREVSIQGVRYKAATLYSVALFPTKMGALPLSPMTVKCKVVVKSKKRRRSIWDDPFFDSFDPFSRQQTVSKILRTEDTIINVIPYPEGQPSDFTGAVGTFQLTSTVDVSSVKVNEAVTLRIHLQGTGNISLFSLPELNFPNNLEVFPPTLTVEKEPFRDNISGRITWEYILIPRHAGRYTIPRIEVPFFNPEDKQWHSTATRPIRISVSPAETSLIPSSGLTKQEVALLGSDIRYIRTGVPEWIRSGGAVPGMALVLYSMAVLMAIIPGFMSNIQTSRASSAEIRESKKALKVALKLLTKPHDDPFTQTSRVVYPYLKNRFLLSTDKLDPLTVKKILSDQVPETDLDELVGLLKTCDAGRYAPGADLAKDTLIPQTKALLKRIDANA